MVSFPVTSNDPGFQGHGITLWYAVAEWYEAGLCDREVAGSTPARGCCVPTPTQRVPSLRGRLLSSSLRATG